MKQRGFIIPGLDTVLLGAAVLGLVLAIIFFQMYRSVSDEYAKYRSDVVAQSAILEANAEKARLETDRVAADVSKAWAAALAYARKHPRIVRVSANCGSTALRPLPADATGATGLQVGESRFSPTGDVAVSVQECEDRLNIAIKDAAVIEHMKVWAKEQSEIKP